MSDSKTLKAWGEDVPLLGPDAPRNNGSIKHMIEYLLTVYERFGNTTITANLQWGSAALWKRDELQERIAQLEAPPTEKEISDYRDLFRNELDKNMHNRSGSPSTDAHRVALHAFVAARNKCR